MHGYPPVHMPCMSFSSVSMSFSSVSISMQSPHAQQSMAPAAGTSCLLWAKDMMLKKHERHLAYTNPQRQNSQSCLRAPFLASSSSADRDAQSSERAGPAHLLPLSSNQHLAALTGLERAAPAQLLFPHTAVTPQRRRRGSRAPCSLCRWSCRYRCTCCTCRQVNRPLTVHSVRFIACMTCTCLDARCAERQQVLHANNVLQLRPNVKECSPIVLYLLDTRPVVFIRT